MTNENAYSPWRLSVAPMMDRREKSTVMRVVSHLCARRVHVALENWSTHLIIR